MNHIRMQIQLVQRSKHTQSRFKKTLILYRKIAVFSAQKLTETHKALCKQNVEFLNVKEVMVHIITTWI